MATGADLRNARIARNRSIDDISRATKVSASILREIEGDHFDKVPAGLFTRGYLRAFAREVGLDPDEVVRTYREEYDPEPPPIQPEEPPASRSVRTVLLPDDDAMARMRPLVELGVIALIAVACFAYVVRSSPTATSAITAAPAPPPVAAEAPKERTVATTGSAEAAPTEVKIEIRATGPCWVEAISGDKRLVARLMHENDTETVTVRDEVSLRIGDPSTLSYKIDGVAGRPLGPAGKPVRVHISPQNYRQFLAVKGSGD